MPVTQEDYGYYASPYYLGQQGITEPCKWAIAAILTSTIRPSRITMVVGEYSQGNHSVMFLVWDWPKSGCTVVPDGFGTHGGEGGRGLSDVLGLIKYFNISLDFIELLDDDDFNTLAEGRLSEHVFAQLCSPLPYDWNFYAVSSVSRILKQKQPYLLVEYNNGHAKYQSMFIPYR